MLFNSLHFVFFLPAVFTLHWLLPFRFRWLLLLAASYYFYGSWNPLFALLLLGTTLVDWWAALKIERAPDRRTEKRWLLLSIISNLAVLAAFKYSAFFYNTFAGISNAALETQFTFVEDILIPVGLSFYTFQSMSYTIDVFRGKAKAEPDAARFALYVSFFPQLVAGPIERYNHLMPQFSIERPLKHDLLASGVRLMLWGFFKKIAIADRLAEFVDPVFAQPGNFEGFTLLSAGFFFAVQVYCDFSGYSDIATGCARLFGYDLMLNWKRPLLANSLRAFWKRNHISMTSWFRDYLYISLGGSQVARPRWLLNLFLTFVLSGLWHGARWTFVIWGALHGIVYMIETLLHERRKKRGGNFQPAFFLRFGGWLYLLSFHVITLIAFRAFSVQDLGTFYEKIFSFDWKVNASLIELRGLNDLFPLLLALALIVFLFLKELNEEFALAQRLPRYESVLRPVFYVLLFTALFLVGQFNANEFIYFHF